MNFMYQSTTPHIVDMFGLFAFPYVLVILPLIVWGLVWKGWALWLAARRGESLWFIALLVVNTMGLLEIFYIFAIAKRNDVSKMKNKEEVSS